jgi:hypothetical protein
MLKRHPDNDERRAGQLYKRERRNEKETKWVSSTGPVNKMIGAEKISGSGSRGRSVDSWECKFALKRGG